MSGDGDGQNSALLAYLNVNGLTETKYRNLRTYMTNNSLPALVLAETWWIKGSYDWDPWVTGSTIPPTQLRTTGHQNHGMILVVPDQHRSQIFPIDSTQYSITFRFFGRTVVAVYLPPQLSNAEISQVLLRTPNPDLCLGDFNIRLGRLSRDSHTSEPARIDAVFQATARQQLHFRAANLGKPRPDHAFCRSDEILRWGYYPSPVTSDHGLMLMEIAGTDPNHMPTPAVSAQAPTLPPGWWGCDGPRTDTIRIRMTDLHNPDVKKRVCDKYLSIRTALAEHLSEPTPSQRAAQFQEGDRLGLLLQTTILRTAYRTLGSYSVNKAKQRPLPPPPDPVANEAASMDQAIRQFKASRRGLQHHLTSGHDRLTPVQAAEKRFSRTFGQTPLDTPMDPDLVDVHLLPANEPRDPAMHQAFSREALAKSIGSYPLSKSAGPDGIHTLLLRALCDSSAFLDDLSAVFQRFLDLYTTPACWNTSKITLITKPGGDPCVEACRPIALTQILRRIFERQLLSCWEQAPWATLHSSQGGFRKRRSALHHALVSDESARQGRIYQAFLDITGAYDHVPHGHLMDTLRERGSPPLAARLVYTLFAREMTTTVVVNGTRSAPISMRRGLFQGSLLSPFLFNLFIDSLAVQLSQIEDKRTGLPTALLFADDIKCQHSDPDGIQSQLDACSAWANSHGLTFGIRKCGIISADDHAFTLQGTPLPRVQEYKYLGFPHSSRGIDWDTYIDKTTTKASAVLRACALRGNSWAAWIRLAVARTFVLPVLSYGLPAVGYWLKSRPTAVSARLRSRYEAVHSNVLDWILRDTAKNTPRAILESVTALPNPTRQMIEDAARFSRSLPSLPADSPFHQLRARFSPHGPWPLSAFIPRLACSQRLSMQYDAHRARTTETDPQVSVPSWTRWIRSSRLEELHAPSSNSARTTRPTRGFQPLPDAGHRSVLCNYVASTARVNSVGADRCLRISQMWLARAALNWRLNRFSPSLRCPSCRAPFTRAHVSRCALLARYPDFARFEIATFQHRDRLYRDGLDPGAYSPVDEMLNQREYDSFAIFWTLLTADHEPPD